jgi:hypothetical protein
LGVFVPVSVGKGVKDLVRVGVCVGVSVKEGVPVNVGVGEPVAVGVPVSVGVALGRGVGVAGGRLLTSTLTPPAPPRPSKPITTSAMPSPSMSPTAKDDGA